MGEGAGRWSPIALLSDSEQRYAFVDTVAAGEAAKACAFNGCVYSRLADEVPLKSRDQAVRERAVRVDRPMLERLVSQRIR
jgi:hypothetical protein